MIFLFQRGNCHSIKYTSSNLPRAIHALGPGGKTGVVVHLDVRVPCFASTAGLGCKLLLHSVGTPVFVSCACTIGVGVFFFFPVRQKSIILYQVRSELTLKNWGPFKNKTRLLMKTERGAGGFVDGPSLLILRPPPTPALYNYCVTGSNSK